MRKNTAAIQVGRLLEVRPGAGFRTVAEVDVAFDGADRAIARLPLAVRFVAVIDWRICPLMASEASDRVLERAVMLNARTERSAGLVSSAAATAALQLVRIARESHLPDRRVFDSADRLVSWLDEVITADEGARLRAFLGEIAVPQEAGQ
jgi:hypothetical protein